MKTHYLSLLSASACLAALLALKAPSCAAQVHASTLQTQDQPVTTSLARVSPQRGRVLPAEPDVEALVSGGPAALTNLANLLLQDLSPIKQARAAGAIGVIAYRNPGAPELVEAIPALELGAESKTLQVRVFALQGLGAVGKAASNAIPLLIRSTKDEDKSVRMCAVEALGRIGIATPQTVDALENGLTDPSGDVGITAVQALYKIGQPASNSIPVLVRLTKDESVGVRCAAVETLGRVGSKSPEALVALESALRDPSEDFVRPLAREALKAMEANHN